MEPTQDLLVGVQSRTRWRRFAFLQKGRKLTRVLSAVEDEALAGGWRAEPVSLNFQEARRRHSNGIVGTSGRAFSGATDYADKVLNHCGRMYSIDEAHHTTIATIADVIQLHTGGAAVDALREAVRRSSATAISEMVSSKPWMASVIGRVTLASRNPDREQRRAQLWSLRNAPTYTFAGVYTALLGALGYHTTPHEATHLAFDIAAVGEGLAVAELSRVRTPGRRARMTHPVSTRTPMRRATDPTANDWPLLGFLIMKLLEPIIANQSPPTVEPGAVADFRARLHQHAAFADREHAGSQ